jgi:subtilisin family serine protease
MPRRKSLSRLALLSVLILSATAAVAGAPEIRYPGDSTHLLVLPHRGEIALDKLAPELKVLYEQVTATGRQRPTRSYSDAQLELLFGIAPGTRNPVIQVSVKLMEGREDPRLPEILAIHGRGPGSLRGSIAVPALGKLAASDAVSSVRALKGASNPLPPTRPMAQSAPARSIKRGQGHEFDKQGMDGSGVIVAVVDTGIDWRHEDFLKPDGGTRLLYLWDFVDESWSESDGAIGATAPVGMPGLIFDDVRFGTLYDRKQINAALAGGGTCNSEDLNGHGTACMSIAAGDGSATANGVAAGTWAGLAPGADLIAVRAGNGNFDDRYVHAVKWILDTAAELGRPCVVNLSLGGHYSSHDGHEEAEQLLNDLVGPEHPGAVICISAGNEGRSSFHAAGRFGPRRSGQMDVESAGIELFIKEQSELHAYFHVADDWGLAVAGLDKFLVDSAGNAGVAYVQTTPQDYDILLSDVLPVADYREWAQGVSVSDAGQGQKRITIPLPPGKYFAWAYSTSEDVSDGGFDFYLPFIANGSFGQGTTKTGMVGSPGNADRVITVGSYDFRNEWLNLTGQATRYNLELGGISDFSSPGYRRDGAIKPDIAGPGRFAVSAAAAGSQMAENAGDGRTTKDGRHLAWEGTSASTPYVAGVVALMLQKNPKLDADQVKEILHRSATGDRQTGAVPNGVWGYGKVNPEAALKMTPKG